MGDNDRPTVAEVRDQVETIEDQNELEDMLKAEADRPGAKKAIEKRLEDLRQPPPAEKKETVYRADDLISNAAAFDTSPAGMAGALHLAGNPEELTKDQATEIVKTFNEREV